MTLLSGDESPCALDPTVHTVHAQFDPQHGVAVVCAPGRHTDPHNHPEACSGHGPSVADAVADALQTSVLRFASPEDDTQACVAIHRGHTLRIRLHRRGIHVLERRPLPRRPVVGLCRRKHVHARKIPARS